MKPIWGVLAAGTILGIAQPLMADVKAGVDAWQQGDYARAVAEWRPLAEAGDPDAQFNMGQAYKLGRGVPTNMATAIDWYRKAAAKGHGRAEDNLGLLMFQQGDRAGALPYLQRSADRGEPRAQYIVGTALFNGDLAGKDWARAYALMSRAAASGLAQANASLKQMDKFIPQDQRSQGLALAQEMERRQRATGSTENEPRQSAISTRSASPRIVRTDPPAPTIKPPAAAAPSRAPAEKPTAAKAETPKPAPSRPASGGAWRVQLGAFSEAARAQSLWNRLSGKVRGLSAYKPFIIKGGAVTRLQVGPLSSSAEAEKLCGTIKAAGAECMPRKM